VEVDRAFGFLHFHFEDVIDMSVKRQHVNEILLRRKNKVIPDYDVLEEIPADFAGKTGKSREAQAEGKAACVATMMKNVEALGYTFSKELYEALLDLEKDELNQFYLELVPVLKKQVGADVVYRPMYPNFPGSVMGKDEARLYVNAIVHYWSFGTLYPNEQREERLPLFDSTKVRVIGLGTVEEFRQVFVSLCGSKTSLSQADREDLEWIFQNLWVGLPDEIPLKENAALIGKLYLENIPLASAKELQKFCRTATDVLRLITSMSNGDVSLATNNRYRSFRRKERRLLLELLENCGQIEEDMLRYREKWIRVGERLHPGEYDRAQFGKVITAFDKLRNHEKIETYGGKVEEAFRREDDRAVLSLLKKRPGEFARRLDHLLRCAKDKNAVVNTFKDVATEVSTPVLLQVREHFIQRAMEGTPAGQDASSQEDTQVTQKPVQRVRVFFPKGNLARCYSRENTLPEIEEKYCKSVVKICENALIENYRGKDFLGNVYLSEEFKHYLVPFSQRSAGKALKTIVRGSRLPIEANVKALRAFIWWTNMEALSEVGRVDLDLSAAIFDENWACLEHVSYTNLRSAKYRACHSGDIVNGGPVDGQGVSEFLDVDMESVVQCGGRYVVYQVYSFTRQPFSEIPHAMFGWMGREDVNSGEIYEPCTVEQKMDLASQSIVCIPVIFDLVEREMIWCDMGLSVGGCRIGCGGNNLESNLSGVAATCYSMVHMRKPNLYDLVNLHIRARGLRVDKKEEADVIFDIDSGITPFDTEVFMGEYI